MSFMPAVVPISSHDNRPDACIIHRLVVGAKANTPANNPCHLGRQQESTKSKTRKSKSPKHHSAATAEQRTPPHPQLPCWLHAQKGELPPSKRRKKKKSTGASSAWGGSRQAGKRAIIRQFRLKLPSALLCCARHRNSGISGNGRRTLLIFSQ